MSRDGRNTNVMQCRIYYIFELRLSGYDWLLCAVLFYISSMCSRYEYAKHSSEKREMLKISSAESASKKGQIFPDAEVKVERGFDSYFVCHTAAGPLCDL